MNLSLFIITLISLAVLLVCYLTISYRSFKHHTVTGLISLLPIVNLLIIPSVWYQIRKPFFVSMIAIVISIAAWFLGGQNYNTTGKIAKGEQQSTINPVNSNIHTIPLPQKPLYYIKYHSIDKSSIAQTLDKSIKIELNNSTTLEGRNQSVNKSTLQLLVGYNENQRIIEVSLGDIKALAVLNDQKPNNN